MTYRDHVEQVREAHSVEALLRDRYQRPVDEAKYVLCPFHADSNPSMSVTDRVFHCFSCQAGGDLFHMVQRLEQKSFSEAVALLAELAGIPPYRQSVADRVAVEVERATGDLTEWAARYYEVHMTRQASDYLTEVRRLPRETVSAARCGYADGFLVEQMVKAGATEPQIVQAGLAVEGRNQTTWSQTGPLARDWLQDRVTFPTLEKGRAVFLSGRTMASDVEPKYLHQKGRHAPLYNAGALTVVGSIFVTEGQIDALSLMSWGFPTVGLLGGGQEPIDLVSKTSPSYDRAALALLRYRDVLLCLDGDAAGRRAALKLAAALGPRRTRIIPLPDGEDPNDVYRTRTREEFVGWILAARDPVEFALQSLPAQFGDLKEAMLAPLWALLAECDPLERHAYFAGPITAWAKGERGLLRAMEAAWRAYEAGPQKCSSCGAPIGGGHYR